MKIAIEDSDVTASGGRGGFDFLHGDWTVRHRRLDRWGCGSRQWTESEGAAQTRPLLGGLCNVEEHWISGRPCGVALRSFDLAAGRWSIYWVNPADGLLGEPVHGGFDGDQGWFEGDDRHEGRPVKVRFHWRRISSDAADWTQYFSFDGGETWEANWIMEFRRFSPTADIKRRA